MGIRPRILLILLLIGVSPALALSVFNYLNSAHAIETELRTELQRSASVIASNVEKQLREREQAIVALASSPYVRGYIESAMELSSKDVEGDLRSVEGQDEVRRFLQNNAKYYVAVACLKANKQPLLRAELGNSKDDLTVRFQTQDFLPGSIEPDERVWTAKEGTLLRSSLMRGSYGAGLRYTIPVFIAEEFPSTRGALMVDINLAALLNDAASVADSQPNTGSSRRLVTILDRDANVLYHTNSALRYQPAGSALPSSFETIAGAMKRGETGWQFYDATDGSRWLAAYQPVAPLNLSVAVASDYSVSVLGLRSRAWLGAGLTALFGL